MEQFFTLTPERILNTVETALGCSPQTRLATGRCFILNSMENRVYEIEMEDADGTKSSVVTKFYRPGRWTKEAILDEHAFIADLVTSEVPAVAPMALTNGSTLSQSDDGIFFAVFPKTRGRIVQELDDARLAQIGRLLGRLHNVGSKKIAPHRIAINAQTYGWNSLETIEKSGLVPENFRAPYRQTVETVLRAIEPVLKNPTATHRIHGDCHLGNVLWQENSAFFLDFDDMLMGPAVQDVWLVVRGRNEEACRQREVLIHGYEQMRAFDRSTLEWIEPLRALRMIHYAAWICKRWEDPTFKNAFPDFGTPKYWNEEISDLQEQLGYIQGQPQNDYN